MGVPQESVMIDTMDLMGGEKTFSGSVAASSIPEIDYRIFIEWYEAGRLDLDQLVTTRYPLESINEACDELENGKIAGRAILDLSR